MQSLELKIPPPIVALLVGVAMWGLSSIGHPPLALSILARSILGGSFALIAVAISVSGVTAIRRAKTTVNPMKPENAATLVTSGVYRFTRNPMYLGLSILLTGWTIFLVSPMALIGPVVFVLYINRFQIVPEERALMKLFGGEFTTYTNRVRRWL